MRTTFSFIVFCTLSMLVFSCSSEQKWIGDGIRKPGNEITFDGDKIITHLRSINDMGDPFILKRTYLIDEKIINDKNELFALYILKDVENGRYSALPEYIVDNEHRKFVTEGISTQTDTKEMLMGHLNKMTWIKDADSLEFKHLLSGSAKVFGEEFYLNKKGSE